MADTKRKQIIDALKERLGTILVVNDYQTDIGKYLSEWDESPLDQNTNFMKLEWKDASETISYVAVGEHLHSLSIMIRARVLNNGTTDESFDALEAARNILSDVYLAIYDDVTFGDLAGDANIPDDIIIEKGSAGDTAAGMTMKLIIEYVTEPGNPFF